MVPNRDKPSRFLVPLRRDRSQPGAQNRYRNRSKAADLLGGRRFRLMKRRLHPADIRPAGCASLVFRLANRPKHPYGEHCTFAPLGRGSPSPFGLPQSTKTTLRTLSCTFAAAPSGSAWSGFHPAPFRLPNGSPLRADAATQGLRCGRFAPGEQ